MAVDDHGLEVLKKAGQDIGAKPKKDYAVQVNQIYQDYILKIDDSHQHITYIGQARPGSLSSQAVWRIKRVDASSGVDVTFADGNANFDNVWDNRASLNYS